MADPSDQTRYSPRHIQLPLVGRINPWHLLVLGMGFVLFFVGLGNHDLWNPNEPIYGECAREMWERGDWLIPYVNGRVFNEKPILYFWAILLASVPQGAVTELAAPYGHFLPNW